MTSTTTGTRPAAVAGSFYPAKPEDPHAALAGFFVEAKKPEQAVPKALIVPHAGYVYSGPVAAKAYARLIGAQDRIRRVVVLGPAHRVHVRGIAAPHAQNFATPLGLIAIDRAAIDELADLKRIVFNDDAHAAEHSLEVQLPFLQRFAPNALLVPLAVGDTTARAVTDVLEYFWDDPATLIVVSSDLSHYLSYEDARRKDSLTATDIEHFSGDALRPDRACGFLPIAGLLAAAKRHGARIERIDLRNSGDTAGPRDRVVGYGSWAVTEAP